MIPLLAMVAATRLVHLSAVDVVIIAFYFVLVLAIGWYLHAALTREKQGPAAGITLVAVSPPRVTVTVTVPQSPSPSPSPSSSPVP